MTIFYLIFTVVDILLIILGNSFSITEDFVCYYHVYLIVKTNWGALFMLIHSAFFFLFAIMIWDIFYRLPLVHGLMVSYVRGNAVTLKSFAGDDSTREKMMTGNDEMV